MSASDAPVSPGDNKFPGYRLGYPRAGDGAMGGFWRRLGGLFVDWFAALGLSTVFFGSDPLATSLLFVGVTTVTIIALGGSLGHLVFGLHLTRLDSGRARWWQPVVRQALLALVIPAIVWDTDHRGGHDLIAGLALRRRILRPAGR